MRPVADIAELEALYGPANPMALTKVVDRMTPLYRRFIEAAPMVMLSTVGPEGTDCSPRGEDGPVVEILDDRTLLLPDWRGNNRMDSLRNIVADGRVSLMFLVPGSGTVVRVNGTAIVTTDPEVTARFEQRGKHPRSVVAVTIAEMYTQCPKAFMRSRFWTRGDESAGLPTPGEFHRERDAAFDAEDYDARYAQRAEGVMW